MPRAREPYGILIGTELSRIPIGPYDKFDNQGYNLRQ
jgi:hypothetical protein